MSRKSTNDQYVVAYKDKRGRTRIFDTCYDEEQCVGCLARCIDQHGENSKIMESNVAKRSVGFN